MRAIKVTHVTNMHAHIPPSRCSLSLRRLAPPLPEKWHRRSRTRNYRFAREWWGNTCPPAVLRAQLEAVGASGHQVSGSSLTGQLLPKGVCQQAGGDVGITQPTHANAIDLSSVHMTQPFAWWSVVITSQAGRCMPAGLVAMFAQASYDCYWYALFSSLFRGLPQQ